MGAGKTTIGKLLAKRLRSRFVDTDEQIEKRAKKTVRDIFLLWGEETFRILERDVVWAASRLDHCVIGVGGGALLHPDSVADLKENGLLIWLRACPHTILRRIPDHSSRPLLNSKGPAIHRLLSQRQAVYGACQLAIRTDDLTPPEVVERILDACQKGIA